jgi:hypothetical protein
MVTGFIDHVAKQGVARVAKAYRGRLAVDAAHHRLRLKASTRGTLSKSVQGPTGHVRPSEGAHDA